MNSTTTCSYTNPIAIYTGNDDFTGFPPDPSQNFANQFRITPLGNATIDDHNFGTEIPFQWGSSTCVTVSRNASGTPLFTQDAGNIALGLSILIVLGFLMYAGFLFNGLRKKKPWS